VLLLVLSLHYNASLLSGLSGLNKMDAVEPRLLTVGSNISLVAIGCVEPCWSCANMAVIAEGYMYVHGV
jgi:hypothetical protein